MSKVYIVITDFNGFAQTRRCLDALSESRYQDFTVLVVDHGTTDETQIELAKDYPWVIRLPGSASLWWAGASNLGIRYALESGARFIMLLNNDCYVELNTIEILLEQSKKNTKAIIAPVQYDWFSREITSLNPRTNFLLGFSTIRGLNKITQSMNSFEVLPVELIVGGRGVILTSEILNEVGFFNEERLPHYGADHDFYLRAVKKGISLYVALRSLVYVDTTKSSLANKLPKICFSDFFTTLIDVRSHRNIKDVAALFKIHYPIKGLYWIGVGLYYIRYIGVYLLNNLLIGNKNF